MGVPAPFKTLEGTIAGGQMRWNPCGQDEPARSSMTTTGREECLQARGARHFLVGTAPRGASGDYTEYDDDRGYGWVAFAGVLLLILGTLNCIEGIAAISNAHFFHNGTNTHYIFGLLNAWGWVTLILGVVQLAVGFGVFAKNQFSRWVG